MRAMRIPLALFSAWLQTCNAQTSILAAMQKHQNDLLAKAGERYGSRLVSPIFTHGFYELADGGNALKQRMLEAILVRHNFRIAFTGISNTAGHDNLISQAYPAVLQDLLAPILSEAGVTFTTSNSAMGNQAPYPLGYCVEGHVGRDPDVVSWEMTMMIEGGRCEMVAHCVETHIRTSISLPSQPIPLVMNCSPHQEDCSFRASTYGSASGTLEHELGRCPLVHEADRTKEFAVAYREYGLHALSMEDLVKRFGCSEPKFSTDVLYTGKVGTPHKAAWHPGPAGHEFTATVLATNYLAIFMRGVAELDGAKPGLTLAQLADESVRTELADKLGVLMIDRIPRPLPPSSFCTKPMCEHAGSYNCYTMYEPHMVPELSLATRVVDTVFDPTPQYRSVPEVNKTSWQVLVSEAIGFTDIFHYDDPTWPIDRKWVISGHKASGPITFSVDVTQLPEGETAPVKLCRPIPTNESEARQQMQPADQLAAVLRVYIDDVEVHGTKDGHPDQTCFSLDKEITRGPHKIRLEPIGDDKAQIVHISHLIVHK